MKDYLVVHAGDFLSLEKAVNEALDAGYDVSGGLCVCVNDGYTHFYQPMLRRERGRKED